MIFIEENKWQHPSLKHNKWCVLSPAGRWAHYELKPQVEKYMIYSFTAKNTHLPSLNVGYWMKRITPCDRVVVKDILEVCITPSVSILLLKNYLIPYKSYEWTNEVFRFY